MYEIVEKKKLAESVFWMKISAPEIAKKRKAGQFVVLRVNDNGERIPLTIADADPENGTLTIVFQVVGLTTTKLAAMEQGQSLATVAGPLGMPTHLENVGTVACIGGGIGVAPVHPIAQAMKNAGNKVVGIIGARNKDLLIMEDMMKEACTELHVATDDGSYGFHGFVSDVLKKLVNEDGYKIDLAVAIGPVPMMRAMCRLTKELGIKTVVSLNPIMVDATGMCGACRVTVGGETKFVCVDGPEFDGHLVDFDEMVQRQRMYVDMEKQSMERFESGDKHHGHKHHGGGKCCGGE